MIHRTLTPRLFILLPSLLTIVACATPQPPTPPPTAPASAPLPPPSTPMPSTPSPRTSTVTPLPFERLAEWDVVIISDSSLWGVAEPYAKLVEQDRGVDEIARLREGQPLILRATDIYNPLLSLWREKGIEDACRVCWDAVNHAARQSAKDHGVLFVSVYDAFNGPTHDQDPRARGLIRDDGEHPSEAGAQFIAELLQQSGYASAGN